MALDDDIKQIKNELKEIKEEGRRPVDLGCLFPILAGLALASSCYNCYQADTAKIELKEDIREYCNPHTYEPLDAGFDELQKPF